MELDQSICKISLTEALRKRHSVRQYKEIPIEGAVLAALKQAICDINRESGLNFQLVINEPKAFDGFLAHYGKFEGVQNYIALVGKRGKALRKAVGYYGEQLVLYCQQLGLHTCWVALTYQKIPDAFTVRKGEQLVSVISVGYGRNRGLSRKTKTPEAVSNINPSSPEWFRNGVEAALLAPTAMNQQKFRITLEEDGAVTFRAGLGFCTELDLGIVQCHFEIGAWGQTKG